VLPAEEAILSPSLQAGEQQLGFFQRAAATKGPRSAEGQLAEHGRAWSDDYFRRIGKKSSKGIESVLTLVGGTRSFTRPTRARPRRAEPATGGDRRRRAPDARARRDDATREILGVTSAALPFCPENGQRNAVRRLWRPPQGLAPQVPPCFRRMPPPAYLPGGQMTVHARPRQRPANVSRPQQGGQCVRSHAASPSGGPASVCRHQSAQPIHAKSFTTRVSGGSGVLTALGSEASQLATRSNQGKDPMLKSRNAAFIIESV